ncbi:hypothetical protein DRI50_09960 [candidate division KSB1 bacterium]|nr:MAG: hypothetical protein DRI50_09960 [candidate division KSB1 bacterium]
MLIYAIDGKESINSAILHTTMTFFYSLLLDLLKCICITAVVDRPSNAHALLAEATAGLWNTEDG